MIHGGKKKKKEKRGGAIKNEENPRSIPHCYERMRPRIDCCTMHIQRVTAIMQMRACFLNFTGSIPENGVTRAGLSSNRIKAIVRVAAACGLKINGTK